MGIIPENNHKSRWGILPQWDIYIIYGLGNNEVYNHVVLPIRMVLSYFGEMHAQRMQRLKVFRQVGVDGV